MTLLPPRSARAARAPRVLLLAALALPAAAAAAAQEPVPPDPDTALALPAITVRTSRETRPWLQVPLASTRITAEDVAGRAGFALSDALTLVPGVVAQSRAGGMDVRLVIRGNGARGAGDRSNAGTSRGVRVLLDGVPETEPDGRTSFDNVDLAAVTSLEVIRSNASALWGNAAGGVVSLTTVDPDRPRAAQLEMQAGSFGLWRGIARASRPMGAQGALAASLVRTTYGGWRDSSRADRWTANVSLLTTLGGRTRLGVFLVASDNLFFVPGPLTRAQVDSAPRQANATYAARRERRHNRLGRIAVSLDHALGGATSLSGMAFAGPKFLQRSERGTFRDFTRYHVGGNLVLRHTRRFGPAVNGTLLAGVDEAFQDGAILFYGLTPAGERGTTLTSNRREGANNLGAFVQQELAVGPRLLLSLGARWDAISYHAQNFITPALDASKTFRRVSPKAGASWRLAPGHSVYVSLGGGVEAPAGNETDPASTFGQDTITALNPLLAPIRSTTLEAGTKRVVPVGGRVVSSIQYDVAVYATRVSDDIVPYRGGRFYFTAGRTSRRGVELGLRLDTRPGLHLQSALTLSRNRYTSYVVDSVHYGRPGATADYSGNRAVGVPDLLYDVGLGWTPPEGAPVSVRVAVQGMSGYFADDANTVRVPGYGLVNVSLGLARPVALGGRVGARAFVTVNNATGRRYIGSAFLNPDVVGGVPVAFEPGLPRTVLVSASLVRLAP